MKLKTKIQIIIAFFLLSAITNVVYLGNMDILKWVDIPNHFAGGMLVAAFVTKKHFKTKMALSLLAVAAIGLGWEGIEIMMSYNEILRGLFEETLENKMTDLLAGLGGLACAYEFES